MNRSPQKDTLMCKQTTTSVPSQPHHCAAISMRNFYGKFYNGRAAAELLQLRYLDSASTLLISTLDPVMVSILSLKTGAVQGHHQTYGCCATSEWPHALHLVHSHVMLWQIQLLACLLVPLPTDTRNLFSAFGFPHASLTDNANFEIVKKKAYLIQVSPAYWTAVDDDSSSEDYMYGIYFASDTFPTATSSSKNS